MDANTIYTEKLVRYLDGELNETEANALRSELENNTAMQQEMDNLLFAKDVIKNYGLKQKVAGIQQSMMQELTKAKPIPMVRNLPKMIMRIAAGVILLTA